MLFHTTCELLVCARRNKRTPERTFTEVPFITIILLPSRLLFDNGFGDVLNVFRNEIFVTLAVSVVELDMLCAGRWINELLY